jgi:hypothetical protein
MDDQTAAASTRAQNARNNYKSTIYTRAETRDRPITQRIRGSKSIVSALLNLIPLIKRTSNDGRMSA